MNWQIANATAMMRARQVHRDLGVDRTSYVDVFTALRAAGVLCHARVLSRLFGFYVAPADGGPAVLLNAELDEIALRHTAAHELGHHVFDHGSQADTDLDVTGLQPDRVWSTVEKQAESFAAWFLMPLPAVDAALERIGVTRVEEPEQAYEVARWLGTSYAGTVRHLGRLKKISPRTAAAWALSSPQRLRARLHRPSLQRPTSHLFMIRPSADGGVLHVGIGDLLALPTGATPKDLPEGLVVADLTAANNARGAAATEMSTIEVAEGFQEPAALHIELPATGSIAITLVAPVERSGIDAVWSPAEPNDRE